MTNGQQTLLAITLFAGSLGAAYGWFSDKSKKLKEVEFNRNLRKQLEDEKRVFEEHANQRIRELAQRETYLANLRELSPVLSHCCSNANARIPRWHRTL